LLKRGHNSIINELITAKIELDMCFDIPYLYAKYKQNNLNPSKVILWKPIISIEKLLKKGHNSIINELIVHSVLCFDTTY
jgi:hypothetical protein